MSGAIRKNRENKEIVIITLAEKAKEKEITLFWCFSEIKIGIIPNNVEKLAINEIINKSRFLHKNREFKLLKRYKFSNVLEFIKTIP